MPMILPVVAAFASGAVTAVIAGTASFAAYASVAGAVMSVAGAITGSKDLQRIGSIVGLVGGTASFLTGASSAAAAGADTAVSGMDMAADAAAGAGNNIATAGGGLQAAAESANTMANAGNGMAAPATPAAVVAPPGPTTPMEGLQQQAMAQQPGVVPASAAPAPTTPAAAMRGDLPSGMDIAGDAAVNRSPLSVAAKQYGSGDLNAWWDKAMAAGKNVGKFVKDNKELVQMGGDVLKSVYGPQSEALDLQKSLMDQARRNINTPVVLNYKGG